MATRGPGAAAGAVEGLRRGRPSGCCRRSGRVASRAGTGDQSQGAFRFLRAGFLFWPRGFGAGWGRSPSSRSPPGCLAAVVRRRGLGCGLSRPSNSGAPDPSRPPGPGTPRGEGAAVCGQRFRAAWTSEGSRAATSLPDPFKLLPLPSSEVLVPQSLGHRALLFPL